MTWRAFAVGDGERREIQIVQRNDRQVPMTEVISLARDAMRGYEVSVPWHLVEATATEAGLPGADPISLWARSLSPQSASNIDVAESRVRGAGLALRWKPHGLEVWHHPTVACMPVPGGTSHLLLTYDWSGDAPLYGLPWLTHGDAPEFVPTLDGRLFVGSRSAAFDCDLPPDDGMLAPGRRPRLSWRLGVKRLAGLLVVRLVRRTLLRERPKFLGDPRFKERLREEEAADPETSASCPPIDAAAGLQERIIVAVHGTASCSMQMANCIRKHAPHHSLFRYEHDTFLPIHENSKELAEHLLRLSAAGTSRFLLVAHSRGGLVACQAAASVRAALDSHSVDIITAGTPHDGTPLAGLRRFGVGLTGVLYRICTGFNPQLKSPLMDGAAAYIISTGEIPPGVSAMHTGSDVLGNHNLLRANLNLRTFGGRYTHVDSGFVRGFLLPTAVADTFNGEDNDIVVPTRSSIVDASSALEQCHHFQYFEDKTVLDGILEQRP